MENTETTVSSKINLADYKPKPFPTKPARLLEYYSFDIKTRWNMNNKPEDYRGFWLDPDVRGYFDARNHIIAMNWSNRNYLLLLRVEGTSKGKDISPIDRVFEMFRPEDYLLPCELRGKEDVPNEVQEIANRFSGTVTNYQRNND